jgi:FdhE protein
LLEAAFGRPAIPSLVPPLDGSNELDLIRASWESGQPAVAGLIDRLDGATLIERLLSVCEVIRGNGSPTAEGIRSLFQRNPNSALDWAKGSLRPSPDLLEKLVASSGLKLDLAQVEAALRLALLPGLADFSRRLCSLLVDATWPHGTCPVCGSAPALAESRGLTQSRHLRCDRCAADWPCGRLLCPFCGASDHRSQRYAFIEQEQDRHRLAICDACGGRLKVVATIVPLSPPGLLVAELAAAHLDFIGDSPAASAD